MSTRSFRSSEMTTAPVRLPDRAWTEVALTDAMCDPQGLARKNLPRIVAPGHPNPPMNNPPPPPERQPTPNTTTTRAESTPSPPSACRAYLNGPNIWLNNAAQSYSEDIAGPLCKGKEDSTKPAECYHILASSRIAWDVKGLSGTKPNDYTRWAPANMIKACQGSNTGTVLAQCVEGRVAVHMPWAEAIARCRVGQAD